MKTTTIRRILAFLLSAGITGSCMAQSGYSVVERGPDYNVLQTTTMENGTNHVHRYIALATGLNYTNGFGQLVESREQISILPGGGAAATQGRHKVHFPGNIYNGVLQVTTPDGRNLYSRPLCVCYDDGSNMVIIATLTNSIGWLTASNEVTYRNCFSGITADLVCDYKRSGFECSLVFRTQPPAPDELGLDAPFTTVQLVTEFFNTEDPQQIPAASDEWYGLQDSTLKFGSLTMTHGKAFAFSGTNTPPSSALQSTPDYKSWVHLSGQTFLVEQVPLVYVADDLNALPTSASIQKPSSSIRHLASNRPVYPAGHRIIVDTNQILFATAESGMKPGVVLDYDEIDNSFLRACLKKKAWEFSET